MSGGGSCESRGWSQHRLNGSRGCQPLPSFCTGGRIFVTVRGAECVKAEVGPNKGSMALEGVNRCFPSVLEAGF